jgi:imidazolonepropionase-like amidohydrolase
MLLKPLITFLVIFIVFFNSTNAQTTAFVNGKWLIGGKFIPTTVYAENGKFTFQKPATIDQFIDLTDKYCVPPFGDAHTHNLDGSYGLEEMIGKYFNEGVFYVQVLGNNGKGAASARPILQKKKLVDATYANGLLTSSYGHGFYPYEPLAMGIYAPYQQLALADSIKKSRIVENISYFFLDNIEAVEKKWSIIQSYKPDHLKIVLMDAKKYEEKRRLEKPGDNGLSEEVAAYVVKKAHQEGLRVFAHVETAADARLCAKLGVDVLAHLPGYGWNGAKETKAEIFLSKKDIALFKKANMTVIPTFNLDGTKTYDSNGAETIHAENYKASITYKVKILRQLVKAKVPLALGADSYGSTVRPEIDALVKNEVFSNQELLDIYSRSTPQSIFPDRKIGEIREGYEASFLVLNQNPIKQIQAIKEIEMKVKEGVIFSKN